ncbi:hypothetical protein [Devriesea agamarum]|uniref:hypothetical protein n=1 Tax=Devriesea agamarum TaxID=472569 RepID=UPI00071CD0B6|nr:hypothetical protein [Devriesea agamarum]
MEAHFFWVLIFGHLFTGLLIGFLALVLAMLACWLFVDAPQYSLVFLTVAASFAIKETFSALFDHWWANKNEHPQPGGWPVPIMNLVSCLIAYVPISLITLGNTPAAYVTVAAAVIAEIAFILWLTPWRPGMTSGEVRKAMKETVEMTERMIKEGRQDS